VKQHTVIKTIWTIAIAIVSVALLWFLLGSTANFQRFLDLKSSMILTFVWAPALLFTAVLIFVLFKKWPTLKEDVQVGLTVAIIILYVPMAIPLFTQVNTRGWLTESITRDYLQTTSDGKYEYRIELINRFQANNRTRLYIRNTTTGEETTLSLDISAGVFGSLGGQSSMYPPPEVPPAYIVMSTMTHINMDDYYLLTTTRTFQKTGIFKIDIGTKTATKLYMDSNYKSIFRRIPDGEKSVYTYSLLLLDRYQDDYKINTEVFLEIIDHETGTSHSISLPVDIQLLEQESLRQGISMSLWVTMEQTYTPGQFIVQTTDELSTEITLRFLVDIELGVIG